MQNVSVDNTIAQIIVREKHRLEETLGHKVSMSDALRSLLKFGLPIDDYRLL